MRFNRYLLILLLLFCSMLLSAPISAQDFGDYPSLPDDLIFISSYEVENEDGTTTDVSELALLDGGTLTYTSLGERLGVPLSWSPQGNKIAVGRFVAATDVRGVSEVAVCIITIADVHEVCIEETTNLHYDSRFDVTWSDDGQKIYFTTWKEGILRLLEADTTTGETVRIIYDSGYRGDEWGIVLLVSWTQNLSHIAIGVGRDYAKPGLLVNLETHEVVDMNELLQPYLYQTDEGVVAKHSSICGDTNPLGDQQVFSPLDNYFVGFVSITYDDERRDGGRYIIFDVEGNVIQTFEIHADYPPCPVWSKDESKLYIPIYVYTPVSDWQESGWLIYEYSFENDEFTIYSPANLEVGTTIIPSSDETHMVFRGYYFGGYAVYVVYPDGVIRRLCEDEHYCYYPLWRPDNDE
jgi:hypothetical protein